MPQRKKVEEMRFYVETVLGVVLGPRPGPLRSTRNARSRNGWKPPASNCGPLLLRVGAGHMPAPILCLRQLHEVF